jgi:hypothetical protein
MAIWREARNSSVIYREVKTDADYGFSVWARFICLLLVLVLLKFHALVRVLSGLIAGFTLLGCIVSLGVAWYQNWPTKFLWTGAVMLSACVVCSVFFCYYDILISRLYQDVNAVLYCSGTQPIPQSRV